MTTIMRWRPLREMINMRDEFDRLFEEALNTPRLRWEEPTNWGLSLDVAENEESFLVKASVPGVNPDDIEITLTDNVLSIKGEVRADETVQKEQYHLRERRFGSFARSITLPVPVNADAIEATYEHGVLNLVIPKAEEIKPRRIQVRAGANGQKVIQG